MRPPLLEPHRLAYTRAVIPAAAELPDPELSAMTHYRAEPIADTVESCRCELRATPRRVWRCPSPAQPATGPPQRDAGAGPAPAGHGHIELLLVEATGGRHDRLADSPVIDGHGSLPCAGSRRLLDEHLVLHQEADLHDGQRHHEDEREHERELDRRRAPLS